MPDYIDRELAISAILNCHAMFGNSVISVSEALKRLGDVPIEKDVVQVVHGKWEYCKNLGIAVCTECGFERELDVNFGRAMCCPNCGADMREEK